VILILSLVIAILLVNYGFPVVLVMFVAQPVKVEGAGMSPTLNDGDRIVIRKQFDQLNRGDIVVFYYPDDTTKSFIKRIVGLPGESIRIGDDGRVNINGTPLDEPYVPADRNRIRYGFPEQTIEAGHYFMMGDNRDASNDSRRFGAVDKNLIYGKVAWRYWPFGKPLR
jgi:signal peptidase I